MNLIENTFDKIGHELEIKPVGYKRVSKKESGGKNKFEFFFNATNSGLSD